MEPDYPAAPGEGLKPVRSIRGTLWRAWAAGMLAAVLVGPLLYLSIQVGRTQLVRDFSGSAPVVYLWASLVIVTIVLEVYFLHAFQLLFAFEYKTNEMNAYLGLLGLIRLILGIFVLIAVGNPKLRNLMFFLGLLLAVLDGWVLIAWGTRLVAFSRRTSARWRAFGYWTLALGVCIASVTLVPVAFLVAIGWRVISAFTFREYYEILERT